MKKTAKKRSYRTIFLSVIMLGVICYAAFSIVQTQALKAKMARDLAVLDAQCQKQEQENKALLSLIECSDDMKFIERIAREKLSYVYPDEVIYRPKAGE